MTFWQKEIMGVAILGIFFGALLTVAELWIRRGGAKPEWTRKLVHVGGGLACIGIPWLVRSPWTVLTMAILLSMLFAIGGHTQRLKSLHGVARKTRGSEYYPFAIFLLFIVSGPHRWLYVASVLVLAVADGFAALIGTRYGSIKYDVEDDQKSLEGSLAFTVIAFLAMHLPMLLMTDLPRETCVLAAFLVAVLVTGFEAISLRGTDNIFVPVAVCVILSKITSKPIGEIAYQTFSMLGIGFVVSLFVLRTRSFNMGGTIVFFLFTYGAWSLGSPMWALPILAGFFSYMIAWLLIPLPPGSKSTLRVRIVFRAILLPLVVLVLGNMFEAPAFFYGPFVTALAIVLALSLWNHIMWGRPVDSSKRPRYALGIGALAWCIVVPLAWFSQPATPIAAPLALGALVPVFALINDRLMGPKPLFDDEYIWDGRRFALTAAAVAIVTLLQWIQVLPNWASH